MLYFFDKVFFLLFKTGNNCGKNLRLTGKMSKRGRRCKKSAAVLFAGKRRIASFAFTFCKTGYFAFTVTGMVFVTPFPFT